MLRRISAHNFKSLRAFTLELGPFTVLVGRNGSGKSSVLDAIRFFHQYASGVDLNTLLEERGGWNGLAAGAGATSEVELTAEWELPEERRFFVRQLDVCDGVALHGSPQPSGGAETEVRLGPGIRAGVTLKGSETAVAVHRESISAEQGTGQPLRNLVTRVGDRLETSALGTAQRVPWTLADAAQGPQLPMGLTTTSLGKMPDWQFLDPNPHRLRKSVLATAPPRVDRTGEGLPALLASLDEEQHGWVREAMQRDVPGFDDFEVLRVAGRYLLLVHDATARGLPPEAVSDGTLRLLALYGLLYSSHRPALLCFEEPETGLHPELIETVVEYLRAYSEVMQVIVTTHSPLLVDCCRPEEVVLLDKEAGVTRALRVDRQAQIEEFLRDWSLGELWLRELLPTAPLAEQTSRDEPAREDLVVAGARGSGQE